MPVLAKYLCKITNYYGIIAKFAAIFKIVYNQTKQKTKIMRQKKMIIAAHQGGRAAQEYGYKRKGRIEMRIKT